ncbi:MAG: hypothetical protein DCF32_13025 [Leptolyngbya sp.]|nr:MAG: hypothetical protein DCF32_13025 [Leptolyngbya sp.]
MQSDLTDIPGIGKTFTRDFARLGIWFQGDLVGKAAEDLFAQLSEINAREHHKTSKNYLYVIRMAIYYAEGGRDPNLLKWHAWKEPL